MASMLVLADRNDRIDMIKNACSGWEADVVVQVSSVSQTIASGQFMQASCSLVILDHADPIEPRLRALEHLRSLDVAARVIVTGIPTNRSEERTELIFSYLEAGAAGYLTDEGLKQDLVTVIQEVLRGGTWIEPDMTIELIQRTVALHDALEMMKPYTAASGHADMLTRRQQEVLELLASGLTNKEIADELFISVGTVKNHVHRILDVLRASSREQAAQYYQFLQAPSATT